MLDGIEIKEYIGVVNANIVIGANFFSDFAASFTDIFGGRSGAYQKRMNEMYNSAIDELKRKALQMGGNAIIGYSIDFDEISGKGKSMFMLNATGTVCKVFTPSENHDEQTDIVSMEDVKKQIDKVHILEMLANKKSLSENDWSAIYSSPSVEYLKPLCTQYYPSYWDKERSNRVSINENLGQLVSLLPEGEVIPEVYKYYPENRKLSDLIISCDLFSPKDTLKLLDVGVSLVINILEANKPYYSMEDLISLEEIVTRLNNLPEMAKHTTGKLGLFGKEEEIVICPSGHKHSAKEQFCPDCGLDNYGLDRDDRRKIDEFKEKVDIIKASLKK